MKTKRNIYEAVQCAPPNEKNEEIHTGKRPCCEARNRGPRVAFASPNPTLGSEAGH